MANRTTREELSAIEREILEHLQACNEPACETCRRILDYVEARTVVAGHFKALRETKARARKRLPYQRPSVRSQSLDELSPEEKQRLRSLGLLH